MMLKMFSRFAPLYRQTNNAFRPFGRFSQWKESRYCFGRAVVPSMLATGYALYFPAKICLQDNDNKDQQVILKPKATPFKRKLANVRSFWQHVWNAIIHIVRFFHLMIIFTPPILLSPLLLFDTTKHICMDSFVRAVERAGVVFIKAFQYLSHRRDMIGPELADKFEYLRENAPTHSFKTTRENFKKAYGKNIQDIFEQFDPVPIASGSVSQVYRAKYKGKKVAVKVRHPNVDKYIERDVNLMFFMSYLGSFFSPAMELPVGYDSLKRTLTEQIDFTFQMRNLNKFNEMFKQHKDIHFPCPFEQTTVDSVLVETYVQGVAVNYYEKKPHHLNKVMARLGSTTFFEMLMKNNFIHADCHGGNIFVDIQEQYYNCFTQILSYIKEVFFNLETKIKSWHFDTERLKQLYIESREEELNVMKMLRKYRQKISVNLIDAGMVIQLNQTDKRNFVNFIKSLIQGKGQMCAQMIYKLSNFQGKKIVEGKFQDYYDQLVKCFRLLNEQSLEDVEGINIFVDMLTIIRQNRMKLDGQFATLLTNMIVLESIAKALDPDIKILKCAFPYFKYVDSMDLFAK